MRIREIPVPALLLPFILAGLVPGRTLAQESPAAPEPAQRAAASSDVITGDHVLEQGEVVEDLVVVGGDLRIRGRVTGDAVVIGGDLILEEGGDVLGDAVVTGGTLVDEGGRVLGEMRTIDGRGMDIAEQIQRAVAGAAVVPEVREAPQNREVNRRGSGENRRSRGSHPITEGLGNLFATFSLALVLTGIGVALVFYARPYLETVSDTVRGASLRAGATGLAATFLVVPAFVVLIVALAVSIVGIPFLLVAIPLYPLALFGAFVFGLLAVAHAIGERTGEQTGQPLDLRYRNSYAYLFTGLGMLMMPLFAAHLIGMTGFLGFIGVLLKIVTWAAIWVCCTVGLGAVILSRAGTRRTFVPVPPDVNFDSDDFFGDEPIGRQDDA